MGMDEDSKARLEQAILDLMIQNALVTNPQPEEVVNDNEAYDIVTIENETPLARKLGIMMWVTSQIMIEKHLMRGISEITCNGKGRFHSERGSYMKVTFLILLVLQKKAFNPSSISSTFRKNF